MCFVLFFLTFFRQNEHKTHNLHIQTPFIPLTSPLLPHHGNAITYICHITLSRHNIKSLIISYRTITHTSYPYTAQHLTHNTTPHTHHTTHITPHNTTPHTHHNTHITTHTSHHTLHTTHITMSFFSTLFSDS